MRKILANQNGSVSLLIAMGVACICAVMIMQMSAAYNGVHKLHSDRRELSRHSLATQKLALQIKQSYLLGKLDPTCGAHSGLNAQKINGAVYCLPNSGKVCAQEGMIKDAMICLAMDPQSLSWDTPMNTASGGSTTTKSAGTTGYAKSRVQNQITVPAPGTSPLERSCTPPATCLRLVVCSDSTAACTLKNADAIQTIRLGRVQ